LLLSACPSQTLWSFDTSPELPHTLFSEIKDNASFQQVILQRYQRTATSSPTPDESHRSDKGKGKEVDPENPLSWISGFLWSLMPAKGEKSKSVGKEAALPQALAKVMNFCFAEMQHERLPVEVKAAAAQCGFDVRLLIHSFI
jgi:senataxin